MFADRSYQSLEHKMLLSWLRQQEVCKRRFRIECIKTYVIMYIYSFTVISSMQHLNFESIFTVATKKEPSFECCVIELQDITRSFGKVGSGRLRRSKTHDANVERYANHGESSSFLFQKVALLSQKHGKKFAYDGENVQDNRDESKHKFGRRFMSVLHDQIVPL